MIRPKASAAFAAAGLIFTAVLSVAAAPAAQAAPAVTADVAMNPTAAAVLAMTPPEYKGKTKLVVDSSGTSAIPTGIFKWKAPAVLTVIDGATPAGYRVDDYVNNLATRTNFGGVYRYSAIQNPDPCPLTQNCAVITTRNAGATGNRIIWFYNFATDNRLISAGAEINTYYPTDQHYRDVAVCAAVSHVAGLGYTRGPTVARSCLDAEPWTGATSDYWTGADWDYINNDLWQPSGLPR